MPSVDSKEIKKKQNIRDGLKIAKAAYKQHRIQTAALYVRQLKNQIRSTNSANDISDKDTSVISETNKDEMALTEGTVDWEDLKEISQEKRQRLEETYGGPSGSKQKMEIEEDNQFEIPKKTTRTTATVKKRPVKLTNKYGVLQKQQEEEPEQQNVPAMQQIKKKWVPPIIINTAIADYKKFISNVTETLGHSDFSIKLNRSSSKIMLKNEEDRNKLIEDFIKTNVQCHSFPVQDERTKKLVLKAAPGLDAEQLAETLKENQLKPATVQQLKGKHELSHSYLVSFHKEQQLNQVKKVENLCNVKVTWEKYARKTNYTQCYRCQAFGHGQTNCYNAPKCVKCPGQHYYRECNLVKTETSQPYCCNCGGAHTANYSQCPKLIEYLHNRNKFYIQNQNINSPNQQTVPSTNNNRHIKSNNVKTGQTYSGIVKGAPGPSSVQPNTNPELNPIASLLGNDQDTQEILKLLNLIVNLKNEFKSCNTQLEKLTVVMKYLEKF